MRAISWSEFNAPTRMLFKQHNLLQLTEFNYFQNACVMYQTVHKMNLKLCELIPIFLPLHTHATRNKNLITGKKRKLKCTSFSITCRGPQIWNELDNALKMSQSISIFKKRLKSQLLTMYH